MRPCYPRTHPIDSTDAPLRPGGRTMTTQQRYAMPVDPSEWIIPSRFDSLMRWEYEDGRGSLPVSYTHLTLPTILRV